METCDVLIVGGGPAGSSCAWALRDAGLDVAVLDQRTFPRDKICGGWITPNVLTALEIDPAEYAREHTLQPIKSFRVGCIGGSAQEIDYGRSVSYGIRRSEFDDYLLKRSGARLLLGTPLTSLDSAGDGWIANHRIRARTVVGAGGHFCPVARLIGSKPSDETAVVAQETEFGMNPQQLEGCRVSRETPELYFCPDMKGYGWCFRKGDVLNVGLGRLDRHQLPAHVSGFLAFLKSSGRIAFDIPQPRGHAYLLAGPSTRTASADGVLLVGDAAGLAYPQSGEGILPAVESGLLAAKMIAGAKGPLMSQHRENYRTLLTSREQSWLANAGQHVPSQWIGLFARSLLKTQWFVREVVLNRWFLHSEAWGPPVTRGIPSMLADR